MHNGIIENYKQIRDFLVEEGYSFVSETDTETVAKLLDYYYVDDPVDTIIKVLSEIKGSYALGIMFRDYPDTVFAVRKESPLIVGVGENENFLASDVPAIIIHQGLLSLEANEIAVVKKTVSRFMICTKNRCIKKLIRQTGMSMRLKRADMNILCSRNP